MIRPVLQDDGFLKDVEHGRSERGNTFRLWWLGQSGFLLQYRNRHFLFDPYLSDSLTKKYAGTDRPHVRMSERVVAPERLDFVDIITSTHNHTDHLDAETLMPIIRVVQAAWDRRHGQRTGEGTFPTLVLPTANREFAAERLVRAAPDFRPINAWDQEQVDRFQVTAVPAAHDQLTMDEQGRHIYLGYVVKSGPWVIYHSGDTVVYEGMAESLRPFNIDVAILPINGKLGNMSGTDAG